MAFTAPSTASFGLESNASACSHHESSPTRLVAGGSGAALPRAAVPAIESTEAKCLQTQANQPDPNSDSSWVLEIEGKLTPKSSKDGMSKSIDESPVGVPAKETMIKRI